jgi:hypothetical protein
LSRKISKTRFLIEIMPTTKPSKAPSVDTYAQGVLTDEQVADVARRIQQAAVEQLAPLGVEGVFVTDLEPPGPLRRIRITCLRCGKQIGGVVTLAAWPHMMKGVAEHACASDSDRHWRKVVRDAFLEGDDERAIAVMRSSLLEEGES